MDKKKIQKNKGSHFINLHSNCLKRNHEYSKGFTLIEALIAIFILTVSVSSMLGVTASSANSARYANNEITANYLLQEAVDYIKNNRDTIAFQKREVLGYGWTQFLNKYGYQGNTRCFSAYGCDIKMEYFNPATLSLSEIMSCDSSSGCNALYYNDDEGTALFYSHNPDLGFESRFKRKIVMKSIDNDQVKITVTVDWMNGNLPKTQTLVAYLLNWQK